MFHDDEGFTFVLTDIINGDDIRVTQPCGGFCLMPEAGVDFSIVGKLRWQKLKRYFAVEFGVFGKVDFSHSTCAEFLDNSIPGYDFTNHGPPE